MPAYPPVTLHLASPRQPSEPPLPRLMPTASCGPAGGGAPNELGHYIRRRGRRLARNSCGPVPAASPAGCTRQLPRRRAAAGGPRTCGCTAGNGTSTPRLISRRGIPSSGPPAGRGMPAGGGLAALVLGRTTGQAVPGRRRHTRSVVR